MSQSWQADLRNPQRAREIPDYHEQMLSDLSETGALYGRGEASEPEKPPADAGCCQNCGRDMRADDAVDAETLRVLGDNHQRVPVCDRRECQQGYFGEVPSRAEGEVVRLSAAVQRARSEVSIR